MTIGILTFHYAYNYGAVIQTWALFRYLSGLGHHARVIDYDPRLSIKWLPHWLRMARGGITPFLFAAGFRLFRWLRLKESRSVWTVQELADLGCDMYIVGSDQVWNLRYNALPNGHYNPLYFMHDFPYGSKLVTYAASIGDGGWQGYAWLNDLVADIGKFDSISVREEAAQQELSRCGVESVYVPDPTLLLTSKDYDAITGSVSKQKKIVVGYLLSEYDLGIRKLKEVGRVLGLERKLITLRVEERNELHPTPTDWLRTLRMASFILTDSFHGTVMAVLFNVPFIVLMKPNRPIMNERIVGLLRRVGLEKRILTSLNSVESLCVLKIDWAEVNVKVAEFRRVGQTFLSQVLEGDRE